MLLNLGAQISITGEDHVNCSPAFAENSQSVHQDPVTLLWSKRPHMEQ